MKSPESRLPQQLKVARVALVGRPNAGKSTLLNSLLESPVSGVSHRPQTTRTNIIGILQHHNLQGEWDGQILIMDTPGVNLEKRLVKRSLLMSVEQAMEGVDTVLWLMDSTKLKKEVHEIENRMLCHDQELLWLLGQYDKHPDLNWILVPTKMDLVNKAEVLPHLQKLQQLLPRIRAIVPVIAKLPVSETKSNVAGLVDEIMSMAELSEPIYPEEQWIGLTQRQFVQNLIRESIFQQLQKEAPYMTDCVIERFQEPDGKKRKMCEVDATIWVSKESLKPIVLGRRGSRIKELGISTRKRYQDVTGEAMVLRLHVKVVDGWSDRTQNLQELGYVL